MDRKNIILVAYLGVVFMLLHVCAIFLPVEYFWGVDQWQYFPALVVAILLVAGVAVCMFPLFASTPLSIIEVNIFSHTIFFLLIPAISFFFFWFLRQKLFFLGDGYFWIRMLEEGVRYRALEPLEVFFHSIFYQFITSIFALSPHSSWALVSAITGVLFVYVAMLLSDYLTTCYRNKVLIFISILSMGTIQLYYGYIETYSIATLLTLLFIYFAVRSFHRRHYVYASFFVFSLAVCSHISILGFSLAFVYLYLLFLFQTRSLKNKLFFTFGIVLAFALPVVITLLAFQAGGFTLHNFFKQYSGEGHILPLLPGTPKPNVAYSLFSYKHFIDIWNELVLIAPISFFALFLVLYNQKNIRTVLLDFKLIFLLIATLSSLILCFLFNMEIGVSRDWDLFSVSALPITIVSILIIIKIFEERTAAAGIIILGCCLLHTIPWIVLNAHEDYSFKRYIKLTSSSTWSRHAKSYAYDELRYYHEQKNDLISALEWAEKAYQHLGNERYRLNLAASYNNVAIQYAKQKRFSEAESYFLRSLQHYPDDFLTIKNIALLYFEKREFKTALKYFERALMIEPNDVESLRISARIYYSLEMYKEADTHLTKALQINQDEDIQRQLLLFRKQLDDRMNE